MTITGKIIPRCLIVVLIMCGASPQRASTATVPTNGHLALTVLSCPAGTGSSGAPKVVVWDSSRKFTPRVKKVSDATYEIGVALPAGRYFVEATDGRCSAVTRVAVINGIDRDLAMLLSTGRDYSSDHNYLTGALPFAGLVATLRSVRGHDQHLYVQGRHFYAEGLAFGPYYLSVYFPGSTMKAIFPINISSEQTTFNVSLQLLKRSVGHAVKTSPNDVPTVQPLWPQQYCVKCRDYIP